MEAEQFQKAKEIFFDAIDLPLAVQSEFIAERCKDDVELLNEIKAILKSHEKAADFIESPAINSVSRFIFNEDTSKFKGTKIGAYQIIREIGRGGMGAVYLAGRIEGFEKQVAVKLIKRGLDTDDIVRRFEQERRILATMDHPHIARLIDGGTTDNGQPFLVMDFVEGVSINEFCERHQTPVDGRLELFLQICSAVAYAHQNLIVHRDIKPSNILVTADGTAKLLDFGVAKLLATDDATATATQTLHAMTPEYASPEQLHGNRVTTATDTYSLGVVLYELLTGNRPASFVSHPSFEKVTTSSKGYRTIYPDGDLGKIAAMALREEPERRYSSVEQFAADIHRYLKGLPVMAQTDSFQYRAGKFVKRNKVPVVAGIGVLFSLVGGIAATSRQSRIARRQRDKAEKVSNFLKKTLAAADPRTAGKDVKFIDILAKAAQTIEIDFDGQPAVAADLHTTIGLTYLSLGIFDSAERHLKTALDGRLANFPRESVETAVTMNNYGRLLRETGNIQAAEPFYREAFEILRRFHREQSLEFAEVLRNYGYLSVFKNNYADALRQHRQALTIRREICGENHTDVAQTLSEIGDILRITGDLEQSEVLQRQALKILHINYGAEHPDIAFLLNSLSDVIYKNNPSNAEMMCRQALEMMQKLLGKDHADTAWSLYKLAYVLIDREKFIEAENYLREILAKRDVSLPAGHLVINSSFALLGRALNGQQRYGEARIAFEECLEMRRQTLPNDHWLVATPSVFYAECLIYLGDIENGRRILLKSYETLRQKLGEQHDLTQTARKKIEKFSAGK